MYCVNCGKELPENARFCLYCGTKVNSIVEAKPQVSNEEILMNHFVNTIPFVYDNLIECKGYPYIYGYINGKVGLIDANDASMIIPCQYDEINPYFYSNNKQFAYSEVQKQGRWGFFAEGEEAIPCTYESINPQECEGKRIYIVNVGNKKGLVNSNTWGKADCIYDEIEVIRNLFRVSCNGKQGMLELDFSELLPCIYDSINMFDIGDNQKQFLCLEQNHKYGVYSFIGGVIAPCVFDSIKMFDIDGDQKQYLCLEYKHKYGLYCYTGGLSVEEVISGRYNSISISNGRFIILEQNNKYGIYDCGRSEEIEPCVLDKIQSVNVIDTKTEEKFIEIRLHNRTVIKELITHKDITVNKFETLLLDYAKLLDSLNIKHF